MIHLKLPAFYRPVESCYRKKPAINHNFWLGRSKSGRLATVVVVHNLHPSTPTSEVGIAITEIGYTVRNVSNILHKTSKQSLPIFFVDLDPAEINNDIFHFKYLLHTKISVEEPHKCRVIIQCTNYQDYGL